MAQPSNTEHSQIVALVFDTDEHTREELSHKLAPALESELSTPVTPLTTDWLSTAPTKTLRITLSTSSPTPITLQHCTHLAHSPSIAALETTLATQITLLPAAHMHLHARPGLAVFDMDSTLIRQEVIDELARAVGKYDQVSAITDAAMRGEAPYTDFETSLKARVALLKGVPSSIWEELKEGTITFTPGGAELVRVLRALGWKTAVLSGGFLPLATWVQGTLGLDYAFANQVVEDEGSGTLTGELVPGAAIVHAERKREVLRELAAENGIPIEWTVAVGDGSNDLLMMGAAGLGVAFNAKPKVQAAAPTRLNGGSLLSVAYMLGCTGEQVAEILKSAG
ncbi:Phosphoserine phosphatase [Friedmanniomyces endolithicus]|uniref:phosphoserine phosphatase n=1 Tax=Friedmanniomyces endolithicus TaxID=329885 RepID=A0A4U0TVQ7_9PEZI|nr:Phosphoserine phosphatase [Friedmanniomyces endolithicus]KAK0354128.1 Phosphoserine phosphatase [Friedmanniomyces endolithicus]KAK0775992.1 Phosphoserine phosphatase [Friedmanniomyces endolithicus]KAK0788089.1 Phosphoserine phosphatase [Friedmanniomyces endolithicus]KAK0802853.1 Phosphoserine phosphatase [Friedmanniomyces endolithicus]